MPRLRAVGPDFAQRAAIVLRHTGSVAAPPDRVFAAVSGDPAGWRRWFPGVIDGAYDSAPPHGVGSLRRVRVRGAGTYRETIVAWEAPRRWAFRVDWTTLPLASALLEEWTVEPDPHGTTVTWTFAVDPSPVFRVALAAQPGALGRVFDRAVRRLDEHLGGASQRPT